MAEKATAHKTKFKTNHKNRLDELVRMRKPKRKNERMQQSTGKLLLASEQLVEAFKQFLTPRAQDKNETVMVEEK